MTEAKAGRFCEKHQEYAANGECRWCDPVNCAAVTESVVDSALRFEGRLVRRPDGFLELPLTAGEIRDRHERYDAALRAAMAADLAPHEKPPAPALSAMFVTSEERELVNAHRKAAKEGKSEIRWYIPWRCGPA